MSERRSVYPGGPHGSGDDPNGRRRSKLRSGESIEAGRRSREVGRTSRRRRTRLLVVGGIALAFGLGAGWYLGFRTTTVDVQISEAEQRQAEFDDRVERVMRELWRMEAEEAARGRGR